MLGVVNKVQVEGLGCSVRDFGFGVSDLGITGLEFRV